MATRRRENLRAQETVMAAATPDENPFLTFTDADLSTALLSAPYATSAS